MVIVSALNSITSWFNYHGSYLMNNDADNTMLLSVLSHPLDGSLSKYRKYRLDF